MRPKLLLTSLALTLILSSCSLRFWAYIRNLTNDIATVDVYIQEPNFSRILPSNIRTANQTVEFKNGHRRLFNDTTQIVWIDSLHFRVFVRSQTTVDLEDIDGYFMNSHPTSDIKVIVTSKQAIDTLMNGRMDFRREKFSYQQNGFIPPKPLLYYDIKK